MLGLVKLGSGGLKSGEGWSQGLGSKNLWLGVGVDRVVVGGGVRKVGVGGWSRGSLGSEELGSVGWH